MKNDLTPGNLKVYTAKAITVIFHPLFMPLYGLILIFTAPTLLYYLPPGVKRIMILLILVNNILMPLALIPFFRYKNIIGSWTMESRNDRVIPLLMVSVFYFVTSFIMIRFSIPFLIKSYFISVSVLSLIILTINFFWKISIHSAGAGAMTGLILMLWVIMGVNLAWYLVPVLVLSGLIMTSRLMLNTHSPAQVYSGFLTGLAVVSAVMLIFK